MGIVISIIGGALFMLWLAVNFTTSGTSKSSKSVILHVHNDGTYSFTLEDDYTNQSTFGEAIQIVLRDEYERAEKWHPETKNPYQP